MKKVLCGLVITLIITGSVNANLNDYFKLQMEKYEQRNWEEEMPLWSHPEQKLEMCSFLHGEITKSLRGPYLSDRSGLTPNSHYLEDTYKIATIYNAVCKD